MRHKPMSGLDFFFFLKAQSGLDQPAQRLLVLQYISPLPQRHSDAAF